MGLCSMSEGGFRGGFTFSTPLLFFSFFFITAILTSENGRRLVTKILELFTLSLFKSLNGVPFAKCKSGYFMLGSHLECSSSWAGSRGLGGAADDVLAAAIASVNGGLWAGSVSARVGGRGSLTVAGVGAGAVAGLGAGAVAGVGLAVSATARDRHHLGLVASDPVVAAVVIGGIVVRIG